MSNIPPAALATEPRPTYRADDAPLPIQLFTVEGSSYGPYVGLPLRDPWTPYSAHLFTRRTAELIVADLHRDDCAMRAEFADDGALTFQWTEEHDGTGGTCTVRPDEHGRYLIGGLWPWDEWGDHVPHTAGQAAFALGAAEYRLSSTTHFPEGLIELYDQGREEAHRVTLRREEPDGAPAPHADADADAPATLSYSVTWTIDDLDAASPREAARTAYGLICRDLGPDADTHFFTVYDSDGMKTEVDLDYP